MQTQRQYLERVYFVGLCIHCFSVDAIIIELKKLGHIVLCNTCVKCAEAENMMSCMMCTCQVILYKNSLVQNVVRAI